MVVAAVSLALGATASIASPSWAQKSLPRSAFDAVGSRVRVTFPTMGRFTGTLLRATNDTVVVSLGASVAHLGTRDVQRLEVSRGFRREILQDAAIGFVAGVALGAAFTAAKYADDVCPATEIGIPTKDCLATDETPRSERLRRYTVPIATFTTAFGAVVGYVGRERWSRVSLGDAPRRVGLTVERADGHQLMGVAIAF